MSDQPTPSPSAPRIIRPRDAVELERRISQWRSRADITVPLHEYLGWSREEYGHWVETDQMPAPTPTPTEVIAQFCADHATTWAREPRFLRRLRAADLTDVQIAAFLTVLSETCHHCWDGPAECRCWKDD